MNTQRKEELGRLGRALRLVLQSSLVLVRKLADAKLLLLKRQAANSKALVEAQERAQRRHMVRMDILGSMYQPTPTYSSEQQEGSMDSRPVNPLYRTPSRAPSYETHYSGNSYVTYSEDSLPPSYTSSSTSYEGWIEEGPLKGEYLKSGYLTVPKMDHNLTRKAWSVLSNPETSGCSKEEIEELDNSFGRYDFIFPERAVSSDTEEENSSEFWLSSDASPSRYKTIVGSWKWTKYHKPYGCRKDPYCRNGSTEGTVCPFFEHLMESLKESDPSAYSNARVSPECREKHDQFPTNTFYH